jgi:hypothetical protein
MPSSPIVVAGSSNSGYPGQHVVGTANNNTKTDNYEQYGYNNNFFENGGNLTINPYTGDKGIAEYAYYTTITLGKAVGVTDTIFVDGAYTSVLQAPGTKLSGGSSISITAQEDFAGHDTAVLNNPSGINAINFYNTEFETVTLVGATNSVVAGGFSTITLNGNATNSVSTGDSTVTIGSAGDQSFGYNTLIYLGTGSAGNVVVAGDENVSVGTSASTGYNIISLGNGGNGVYLQGQYNRIQVGGGNNTITAGSGNDDVTIVGLDGQSAVKPAFKTVKERAAVPRAPTDSVTLAGSGNAVTATYEDVTVAGTATTGMAVVTLGNGANTVSLAGAYNQVTLGSGANSVALTGDSNLVTITDMTGKGTDTVDLGSGSGNTVNLGMAGGLVTSEDGAFSTITQDVGSKAAVTVDLGGGAGAVTLGGGRDTVTVGAGSSVTVGSGNDTVTAGDNATVLAGSGNDTFILGAYDQLGMTGSASSHTDVVLGNDDIVAVSGGHVTTHDTVGNDLIYLEGTAANSSVNFSALNDIAVLGLDASAHLFLYAEGGNVAEVRASDANGSYAGQITISNLVQSDVMTLSGLVGGTVSEALNSYGAVLDNLSKVGGKEVLALQGGGSVTFDKGTDLSKVAFNFLPYTGPVIPNGL